MKKILSVFFAIAVAFCVTGCAEKDVTPKEENTKLTELQQILENTCFDAGVDRFEGKTFGEVVSEVIEVNPEENLVYYRLNEYIFDFDSLQYSIPDYDPEKYDYITSTVRFNAPIFDECAYEEMLFKIDKNTKTVTPVGRSFSEGEWSFNESVWASYMMLDSAFWTIK